MNQGFPLEPVAKVRKVAINFFAKKLQTNPWHERLIIIGPLLMALNSPAWQVRGLKFDHNNQ